MRRTLVGMVALAATVLVFCGFAREHPFDVFAGLLKQMEVKVGALEQRVEAIDDAAPLDEAAYDVDMRPIGFIGFIGGQLDNSMRPVWKSPESAAANLDAHFARGYEVYMLHMPGLVLFSDPDIPTWTAANPAYTLPDGVWDVVKQKCRDWLRADPGRRLYGYTGGLVLDPFGTTVDGSHPVDVTDPEDRWAWQQTLREFEAIGCSRLYIDSSSKVERWDEMESLFPWMLAYGIVPGWEGPPHLAEDRRALHLTRLNYGPGFARLQLVAGRDPDAQWRWHPDQEMGVLIHQTPRVPDIAAEVQRRVAAGWRLVVQDQEFDELIQRAWVARFEAVAD